MEKIKEFDKKGDWDEQIYYKIDLDEDGDKALYFFFMTSRIRNGNIYDDWGIKKYDELNGEKIGKLKDLLEWGDIYYGISSKIGYFLSNEDSMCFNYPDIVYVSVELLICKQNGIAPLSLCEITEDTECGTYYGY